MNYELPSAPLSIGGVIDSAIRLYRNCIGRCWILALLYSGLLSAFGIVWGLSLEQTVGSASQDPRQALALLLSPASIGGFVLVIVISMAFYGALMKMENAVAQGDASFSLGKAIAEGLRRLPGALLGTVISVLAIGISSIALVIPGIYVFGKLQLWIAALFVEDVSALQAIEISWRLTRKRWWRGATIITVASIMLYVFALAFGIVAGIVGALVHLSVTGRLIVNQLFSLVSNMIFLPMFVAIVLVMYHDFKLRSEGGDLAARVGSVSKA